MNEINIRAADGLGNTFSKHPFPVIDFKFRNSGTADSFLTEFFVEIQEIEIDVTPVLRFDWALGPLNKNDRFDIPSSFTFGDREPDALVGIKNLLVRAQNMGWGPANELQLNAPEALAELFPKVDQAGRSVPDDEHVTLFNFSLASLDEEKFRTAAKQHREFTARRIAESEEEEEVQSKIRSVLSEKEYRSLRLDTGFRRHVHGYLSGSEKELFDRNVDYVNVSQLSFDWQCRDTLNRSFDGRESLSWDPRSTSGAQMLVTEEGFQYVCGHPLMGAGMPPGPTYCIMIDADSPPAIRSYQISRMMDAGGLERFQILIGANKSCLMRLRLGFNVDGGEQVLGESFEVKIDNLRSDKFHRRYQDGQEILETVTEDMEEINRARMFRDLSDGFGY